MLEYSGNTTTRDAMARAHVERAMALRTAWIWLFGTRKTAAIAAVMEPV